jgi:hypothetical protein
MSITVPAGTRIYLTKLQGPNYSLFIRPDTSLFNDNLYVAYDVKIGTVTAIRKGTRVSGNWITESTPIVSAQFQSNKIYFNGTGQDFFADSDPVQTVTVVNPAEVDNANAFFKDADYRSTANITRRIVTVRCRTYPLPDDLNDFDIALGTYLNINLREIPATVISNLVITCL